MIKYFQNLLDLFFKSHPRCKSFCFRWLPFRSTLIESESWSIYLSQKRTIPEDFDKLSNKLIRRLLDRRIATRYLFTITEIWSYIRSQHKHIPYWFPCNGTLLKSVFMYKAGIVFLPLKAQRQLVGRDAIDGGAASGDSSIVLSDCGARKVYAFEPSPQQQIEMRIVLNKNNKSELIDIVPLGLAENNGMLTAKDQYGNSFASKTTSIDCFCDGKDIGCIKLDIEGAEFPALRGAMKTISRCKPILIICVYHRPEDLFEMPKWLLQNFPDYRIVLRDTEPANRGAGVHLVMIAYADTIPRSV